MRKAKALLDRRSTADALDVIEYLIELVRTWPLDELAMTPANVEEVIRDFMRDDGIFDADGIRMYLSYRAAIRSLVGVSIDEKPASDLLQ